MACLSLLPKQSDRLERLLTKVDISLKNYLHSFGEDGSAQKVWDIGVMVLVIIFIMLKS